MYPPAGYLSLVSVEHLQIPPNEAHVGTVVSGHPSHQGLQVELSLAGGLGHHTVPSGQWGKQWSQGKW